MSEVALLRQAVESEVSRVSADKALADGLVKRFGADAEKYLADSLVASTVTPK